MNNKGAADAQADLWHLEEEQTHKITNKLTQNSGSLSFFLVRGDDYAKQQQT